MSEVPLHVEDPMGASRETSAELSFFLVLHVLISATYPDDTPLRENNGR